MTYILSEYVIPISPQCLIYIYQCVSIRFSVLNTNQLNHSIEALGGSAGVRFDVALNGHIGFEVTGYYVTMTKHG